MPGGLPSTQHAVQITGPGQLVHNRAKPVPRPGPTQILARVEAVGLCFSDTKLLHAFSSHPRKSDVVSGLSPAALAEIPSYVPGGLPTVPGHEVVCRIVAVGTGVRHHRVGERCLVQTDYRHLPTAVSNSAFGYNFEGGLQEYVLMDERVIIEPETHERFLIPVADGPSAAAIALLEPWACVEASYAGRERRTLLAGGRLLIVADAGHAIDGLDTLLANTLPSTVAAVAAERRQRIDLEAAVHAASDAAHHPAVVLNWADGLDEMPPGRFDDIVYFGADPGRIEGLQARLAPRGTMDVVLDGRSIGRPVAIDVGRIHYDHTRIVGTAGASASDGYDAAPDCGEIRDGDRIAVIGAAGPMGLMHVVRAVTSGRAGLALTAIDIDPSRLEHLARTVSPLAARHGVSVEFVDSRQADPGSGFTYIAVMVPSPSVVSAALEMAAPGCRVNLFAGFPIGTQAQLGLDPYLAGHGYLLGTSGSCIADMKAVVRKLERGELDSSISLDAVSGLEGVAAALREVERRTPEGKIVVYPGLHEMGVVRLRDLPRIQPSAAAGLRDGRWSREAEEALLTGAVGTGGDGQPPHREAAELDIRPDSPERVRNRNKP